MVATLVFVPVLEWNHAHDWISFRFQIQHGLGKDQLSQIAAEHGLNLNDLTAQLTQLLPVVVDKLTPHGQVVQHPVNTGGGLADLLKHIPGLS